MSLQKPLDTAQSSVLDNTIEMKRVFEVQKHAFNSTPYPSIRERLNDLAKLSALIHENKEAIITALNEDFGHRSSFETKLAEIYTSVTMIKYLRKNLKKLMKVQKRHVNAASIGARNRIILQPKGVVGNIVPWNGPVLLALTPAATALAAGNRCMILVAESAPNTANLLRRLIPEYLPEDKLYICQEVPGPEFGSLPFDHLIFTGSTNTGKKVMEQAAKNLTPVTLELGGKSPSIIHSDYDIKTAASRILAFKALNAGQVCVSCDYVYVPSEKLQDFIIHSKEIMPKMFPDSSSEEYTSIIDTRSYARQEQYLKDAEGKGAEIVQIMPGQHDPVKRKIPVYLIINPTDDMLCMQEEIFGPILPVKPYDNIDDVIDEINRGPRPLALYVFSHDRKFQKRVIYNTLSGGVSINAVGQHAFQHDLPFGGIGMSGMGAYHGKEGFFELSKLRSVYKHPAVAFDELISPPYTGLKHKIMDFLINKEI